MGNCPDKGNIAILRKSNPGNGAREALMGCFPGMTEGMCDSFLAKLWLDGFKIVPLDQGDQ